MNVVLDFENGEVIVNSKVLTSDQDNHLLVPQSVLVSESKDPIGYQKQSRLVDKFEIFGSCASLVVQSDREQITSVYILFDEIIFLEKSMLESKTLKSFQRKYGFIVTSTHPTVGKIGEFDWGNASFSYDPRQGELTLRLCYLKKHKIDASKRIDN